MGRGAAEFRWRGVVGETEEGGREGGRDVYIFLKKGGINHIL